MKNLLLVIFSVFVTSNIFSQVISFPDYNFKAKLLSAEAGNGIAYHNGSSFRVDVNNDGEIEVSEALLVTSLAISNSNILDLTGIEYFTNLEHLQCNDNLISDLNLSPLTKMVGVDVVNNNLTSINVNGLTDLFNLGCNSNQLTFLDISGLINLHVLHIENNQITSLNLGNTPELIHIYCQNNQITNLDTSDLINLRLLDCSFNNLETLNIRNESLEYLNFSDNNNLEYICADALQLMDVEDKISEYGYVNCYTNSLCSFVQGESYYTVLGNIKYDENVNGCDVTDIDYPELMFLFSDGTNVGTAFADESGNYHYNIQGGDYSITPVLSNSTYFSVSPDNVEVSFPIDTSPNIQDFCTSPNGVYPDLEISLLEIEAGYYYSATYKIVYKNKGTMRQSGSINFSFDDEIIDLNSSEPSVSSQSANQLVWEFIDLLPFETREIDFELDFNTPEDTPPLNNEDILSFTGEINTSLTDETPEDNTFVLNQTFFCCLLDTPSFVFSDYFSQYPNPTSDILNLKMNKQIDVNSITIFNLLGQEVKKIPFSNQEIKIDVSKLESGHYFIRIMISEKELFTRFIRK